MIVQASVTSRLNVTQRAQPILAVRSNSKKCGSRPPLVEQTGVPNISTLKERFSLIHNILHSVKTGSDSYFCQIKFKQLPGQIY